METRRQFIKNVSLLTAGSSIEFSKFDNFFSKKVSIPLGIQLYTFFNSIDKDLKGTLQKIRNIGYEEVESAFSKKGEYYGMKPQEFAQLLKDTGLRWRSHHVLGKPFNGMKMLSLQSTPQQIVDDIAESGAKYLVCSFLKFSNIGDVNEGVDILSKAGEIAAKSGITVCYHNHEAEFQKLSDINSTPFEILVKQTKPEHLQFELDLAWVSKTGTDPVQLFNSHKGRFPLLHLKDFDKDFKNLMPVGEGSIDFERILKNAKVGGVKYMFVEHDNPTDAFRSVKSSFDYLKKNIVK